MSPGTPTLVLADAHLRGEADPNQADMVRFLSDRRATGSALVLLGDFFEFLAGENRAAVRAYRPVLDSLSRFERLDYVEGNHDFDLSNRIPGLGHARIHAGPADLLLGGLRCRLLHGDRSSPTDLGTRALKAALQSAPIRFARDRLLPDRTVFRFALAFAVFSRRYSWPGRAVEADTARRLALVELDRSEADAVIFAHTHRPLLERTPAGLVANPGAAVPGGSFLEIEQRRLRLRRFPDGELLEEIEG